MQKKYITALILSLTGLLSCAEKGDDPPVKPDDQPVVLSLADKNATAETKALYSNLWQIQKKGFMFGHHDDLWYGRKWYNTSGGSDTKDVCGDYPAVFSVDFATIIDDRATNPADIAENEIRKRVIIEAYNRGEVIIACCHWNNPLTGGDAWDNSNNNVAKEILINGSATNSKFKQWLDRLADFAATLKGSGNERIPIIFRPFHEHTQAWSWWGSSCTTQAEFIALWQFTVNYLRDTKGVHQFIYAISPQMDSPKAKNDFLFRWPGNDYVDFIGMDCYHGLNPTTLTTNINVLSKLSKELKKPCGITETGVEGIRDNNGTPVRNYWTQQILNPATGQSLSMIVMWRNKYDPAETGYHYFSVFPGHASADDFKTMYKNAASIFSADLSDMYTIAENITVD
ncbi:MAG: glycoside hydrolase family 26 protein [Prevotellaceae bacterium]|jgi:mannan endo-1,4-beta-mannosidase|nr:glycoside hydrolase family 26 protein [Prevotellaceae bacterium]